MVRTKQGILPIGNLASHDHSHHKSDDFENYFHSAVRVVPWQNERVQRTVDPFDRR